MQKLQGFQRLKRMQEWANAKNAKIPEKLKEFKE